LFENLAYRLIDGVKQDTIDDKEKPHFSKLLENNLLLKHSNQYFLQENYYIGQVDVAQSGTGFCKVFSKQNLRDFLIESNDLKNATKNDIVVIKELRSKRRPKAKVVLILKKEFATTVVYTKKVKKQIVGINLKTSTQVPINVTQKSLKQLPPNTVLKLDSTSLEVLDVIGVLEDDFIDEKISLALFNRDDEFLKSSTLEAKSFGNSVDKTMYPDAVDLTHLPFCTIDPNSAKDFDDAIYFDEESFTIYVAIADVSSYVTPFSSIDKESLKRGFSIYFPHKAIPMLPRNLSENICSLKPSVDRLAFTFKITIDKNSFEIKNEEIMQSIIHSKRRFTYDEVDDILEGKESLEDELSYLLPLNKLTKKLKEKRLQNSCEFVTPETRLVLNEKNQLVKTETERQTASHSLIEDCMLLANKAAAKKLTSGIFRIHEDPSPQKIEELLSNLSTLGIFVELEENVYELFKKVQKIADELGIREDVDKMLIKSQKKASYSSLKSKHFALGFKEYTHFTSPIRRYSDLIVHRLLKAFNLNDEKQINYLLKDIEENAKNITNLETICAKVEMDFKDRKFARWALENLYETFEAVVIANEYGGIAKIEDENVSGARVFLNEAGLELFSKINVQITEVDIPKAKIYGVQSTDY
jgi:ribonuclease R